MAETLRVRVSPSTLSREIQGETVLLQLDKGEYFGLNEVGTRIWQLIAEDGSLERARGVLLQEFDVAPDVLATDFDTLIDELVARQLIEVDPV